MKQFTVEHDERVGRFEVVRWTYIKNSVRMGSVVDKFDVEQDAKDVCEFYNDTQLPDVGCEFDSRYEVDVDYN